MTNHYHLLVQTPNANISRAMRHINGVYTQRYNRENSSDGSLFRGRFKSILIDRDSYFLQLSRYIHRNPVETKKPMVDSLDKYPWSSYPAYVNKAQCPNWLTQNLTYQMLGARQRYAGYAKYVAGGNSEQLTRFYSRGNMASVIGDKDFVTWFREEKIPEVKANKLIQQTIPHGISIEEVSEYTAKYYKLSLEQIRELRKGRKRQSIPRKVAIFLCQHLGDHRLKSIKEYFGLGHIGSVSYIISNVKAEMALSGELKGEIDAVIGYIINNAT